MGCAYRSDRYQEATIRARALLLCVVTVASSGCTYTYVDQSGNHRTLGLGIVDIVVRSAANLDPVAGDIVDITTFGISVGRTAQGGYLTAGYNHEVSAALRDDALVLGNPVSAIRQRSGAE